MIERAYVMPHPPIVLPEVGRGEEEKIKETSEAMKRAAREIAEYQPDTIVLTSPHAPMYRDGFFIATSKTSQGDLRQFGIPRDRLSMDVENDREFIEALQQEYQDAPFGSPLLESKSLDHGSIIPLRFIQEAYRDFKLLRLGISGLDAKTHFALGQAIEAVSKKLGRRTVFVASGDLSHVLKEDGPYGFRPQGPAFDEKLTQTLRACDWDALLAFTDREIEEAAQCGLRSFQIMAGALADRDFKATQYSYQGTFGVGYAILAFSPKLSNSPKAPKSPKSSKLPNSPKAHNSSKVNEDPYIKLARETIETYIREQRIIKLDMALPQEMLDEAAGVFVTIHKHGKLRGCIGTIQATTSCIAEEIRQNAISSATEDPRFPAVTEDELADLEISVDVLGDAEPIQGIDELDPQRYGVIVSRGFRRGLLLPRLEGIDDPRQQIAIALQKANIFPDEDYELERFEVVRHE